MPSKLLIASVVLLLCFAKAWAAMPPRVLLVAQNEGT